AGPGDRGAICAVAERARQSLGGGQWHSGPAGGRRHHVSRALRAPDQHRDDLHLRSPHHLHHPGGTRERCGGRAARGLQAVVPKTASVRVPASSANLGPGFDVLALALDLHLDVAAREAKKTTIVWEGEGAGEVPLTRRNLLARAAQEPFNGWSRPLEGLELTVRNQVPIGRGLGSSAAAIVAGIVLGAKLRGLRMSRQRV